MNRYNVNLKLNKKGLKSLIKHLSTKEFSSKEVEKILRKYPKKEGGVFSKSQVLLAYKTLIKNKDLFLNKEQEEFFLLNIRMKKVRTLSGVVPVAVLTKPFPCPGRCIFCPNDVKMPKSYLSSEPGALRALSNKFDPYLQTYNRLVALKNIGHTVQKIEIIILGGTWSSYPKSYQIWFIKRCFDALNDFNKDSSIIKKEMSYEEPLDVVKKQELPKEKTYNLAVSKKLLSNKKHQNQEKATLKELMLAHKKNETAYARCVGLVIETRPDVVNKEEVIWLRTLGVTKVQIGVQSTSNKVLKLNKRDHLLETSEEAVNLLRRMGFKIHLHWMCNLYGSNPQKDKKDFKKLFTNINLRPDELKVYPCSLIEGTDLVRLYKKGLWKPYSKKDLLSVLRFSYLNTPRYCRISRMIRDIPSTDILVGNKETNFRQTVEGSILKSSLNTPVEIRSREVKDASFKHTAIKLKKTSYKTGVSTEYFLEYILPNNKLLGFLRLSLPKGKELVPELKDASIIREVHVYGVALSLSSVNKEVQHLGLGKSLIQEAEKISRGYNYKKICVISAIGTRGYYRKQGYKDGVLYQYKKLK